ncbi:oligomeric Golgi complex subunit 7 [Lentinula aciculospora]|uniref:Conserved oligomeric Golgi complex subunit 7 n=1 Tax=Lentinula aciculospora TaxID=153920 RepID=A0A9W9AHY9_9AGAR|nr:oligomeric Golgi complex subunit 7 [Lentinula aciculospora]
MTLSATAEALDSLEEYEDITTWMNDTLTASGSEKDLESLIVLDQQITQLIASLDIACEDTSSQLERTIDDVSRGIPRLTYDLHFIKDSALSLQNSLTTVQTRSRAAVPDTTASALEQLKRLDTMKGHMEAAREVLREAESWSTLELEVTSMLAERNYAKAASRLSEANKSMVVFQNTPEYDPRRTLLVNLQNQLEASLSSALVAAINEQNLDTCRSYFYIFSNIQRELEFRNYYYGSRRASLTAMWHEVDLSDTAPEGKTSLGQTFSDFLPKFYASMLALLNQERTSIPAIFPDPVHTLSAFISSILSALQPTFSQRLVSLSSYYADLALKELIVVFRVTEEFAVGVAKLMEKIQYSAVPPSLSDNSNTSDSVALTHPTHNRKRSMRMSISFRSGTNRSTSGGQKIPSLADGLDWDQELFHPFLEFQVNYGSLERRLLDHALREIVSNDSRQKAFGSDQARIFRERAVDIFGVAEESLVRYAAFTHGYGSASLLQALDGFLKSFIDMWTADVSFTSSGPHSARQDTESEDLSGLDYTSQDWLNIQTMLHLLGSARSVYERMISFEVKLRSNLAQTATKFRLHRGDPTSFPITNSKGVEQILEQSSLNSADLHALLDKVDLDPSHSRETSLRHQGTASYNPGEILLTDARSAMFDFAKACQSSLQGTILSPLRQQLVSYASSSIWATTAEESRNTTFNDLQVPTFSLSPSDIIQRVTEGLLNLPRLFEVYADDDALSFSLQTLPYADPELLKNVPEVFVPDAPSHSRRHSIAKPANLDPETVSTAWLSSLGQSLLAHLTTEVLPRISRLNTGGAAQLASDLGYLSNVIRVLNVESEELEQWKEYVELKDDAGKVKVNTKNDEDRVLNHVARMRGWKYLTVSTL